MLKLCIMAQGECKRINRNLPYSQCMTKKSNTEVYCCTVYSLSFAKYCYGLGSITAPVMQSYCKVIKN